MADYSISKDPTATNLTQSKNSKNRVTITKNPGSTKAYFTKSGGTEVSVVKQLGLGPELSPDVGFDIACGGAGWNCTDGGFGPPDTEITGSQASIHPNPASDYLSLPMATLGISIADNIRVVMDVAAAGSGDILLYSGGSGTAPAITTTGLKVFDMTIGNWGGDATFYIAANNTSGNTHSLINSMSLKKIL